MILEIDHIKPISKGGQGEILNLITSCRDCNRGKSNRELNDDTVVKKQQEQLKELQERKEQIEMLFEWKNSLLGIQDETVEKISDYWKNLLEGNFYLNDNGKATIKKLADKYPLTDILDSMEKSVNQYYKSTHESAEHALKMIERIIINIERQKEKPYLSDLYYIRGIARNHFGYINEYRFIKAIEKAHIECECKIEELKQLTLECRNWTQWKERISEIFNLNEIEYEGVF